MILKLSSAFIKGAQNYEPPFYVNICESKIHSEVGLAKIIAKMKGVYPDRVRVRLSNYNCWGIDLVSADGRWVRWYAANRLSQKKQENNSAWGSAKFTFASNSWDNLEPAPVIYHRNAI